LWIDASAAPSRRNPEQQARENGNARCKREHANVHCDIERNIEKSHQQAGSPFGEQNSNHCANA